MKIYDVIIIGAGQAGLAMAYYLKKENIDFLMLERSDKVAARWHSFYDSIQLITPAPYLSLPGRAFTAMETKFPSKEEVIKYFEAYATPFYDKIRFHTPVNAIEKNENGVFVCETTSEKYFARQVVIASGYCAEPYTPPIAEKLSDKIFQIHASTYKNNTQIPLDCKNVMVVGAGNTGISIAKELSENRKVFLAQGKIKRFPRSVLGKDIFWWADKAGVFRINRNSSLGRRMAKKLIPMGDATYGLYPSEVSKKYGVTLIQRIIDTENDVLIDKKGEKFSVDAVIWATGYRPNYHKWVNFPIYNDHGMPYHKRGITDIPGLYFLGLKWQYTITSFLIFGVGNDAEFLMGPITAHRKEAAHTEAQNFGLKSINM